MADLHLLLRRLTLEGVLSEHQSDAVLTGALSLPAPSDAPPSSGPDTGAAAEAPSGRDGLAGVLPEIGGYVGGVFVFAAALVIGGTVWQDVSHTGQVIALLAIAALLLAGAVGVGRQPRPATLAGPRGRLASTLTVLGAAAFSGMVAVAVDAPDTETWVWAAYLVVVAPAYLWWRGPLLHVVTALALAGTLGQLFSLADSSSWPIGLGVLIAAAFWAAAVETGRVNERSLGYLLAGALAFVGAEFWAAEEGTAWATVGYVALLLISLISLAGYARRRDTMLLVVGVVTLGVLVPQAVIDYTDGALGAGGGLLVVGLSIVAASLFGVRLRRRASSPEAQHDVLS